VGVVDPAALQLPLQHIPGGRPSPVGQQVQPGAGARADLPRDCHADHHVQLEVAPRHLDQRSHDHRGGTGLREEAAAGDVCQQGNYAERYGGDQGHPEPGLDQTYPRTGPELTGQTRQVDQAG